MTELRTPIRVSKVAAGAELPLLREDLRLFPGAPLANRAPSWLIYDPSRNRYFQIGDGMFQLLSLWTAGTPEVLLQRVEAEFGTRAHPQQLAELVRFLSAHCLLVEPLGGRAALLRMVGAARHGWLKSAVHNYLFFRIPLVRPQKFLEKTAWLAQALSGRVAIALYALLTLLGLLACRGSGTCFSATFPHFFNWENGLYLAISIGVVKTAHEMGHAYTAVRYGTRVQTMGIAFLVMTPVLYTDVSDSWRLRSASAASRHRSRWRRCRTGHSRARHLSLGLSARRGLRVRSPSRWRRVPGL